MAALAHVAGRRDSTPCIGALNMKRLFSWEQRTISAICNISFMAGFGVSMVEVVRRYLFGRSFVWGNEAVVFLIMFPSFLFLGVAARADAHIRVTLLDKFLSPNNRRFLEIVIMAIEIVFIGVFSTLAWRMLSIYMRSGVASVGAGLPMYIGYGFLFLGFALLGLHSIERLYVLIRGVDRENSVG